MATSWLCTAQRFHFSGFCAAVLGHIAAQVVGSSACPQPAPKLHQHRTVKPKGCPQHFCDCRSSREPSFSVLSPEVMTPMPGNTPTGATGEPCSHDCGCPNLQQAALLNIVCHSDPLWPTKVRAAEALLKSTCRLLWACCFARCNGWLDAHDTATAVVPRLQGSRRGAQAVSCIKWLEPTCLHELGPVAFTASNPAVVPYSGRLSVLPPVKGAYMLGAAAVIPCSVRSSVAASPAGCVLVLSSVGVLTSRVTYTGQDLHK